MTTLPVRLRWYQREARDAVIRAHTVEGLIRMVVGLPTGAGKTMLAAALAYARTEWGLWAPHAGTGRTLFLAGQAATAELLRQARKAYGTFYPAWQHQRELGIVQGANDQPRRRHLFASVNTLIQPGRLAPLLRDGPFDLIIVDECDLSVAPMYQQLLGSALMPMGPLISEHTVLVGITATPNGRSDGRSLQTMYQDLVYSRGYLDLITCDPPYLCDVRRIGVGLDDVHLPQAEGDWSDETVAEANAASIADPESRYQLALDLIAKYCARQPGLYFGASVADARTFTAYANSTGWLPTALITAKTPDDERRAHLEAFKRGELLCLANMGVFTRGYDEHRIRCMVLGRQTKSSGLYLQMLGRGARPYPGEPDTKPYEAWTKQYFVAIELTDHEHQALAALELTGRLDLPQPRTVRRLEEAPALDELESLAEAAPEERTRQQPPEPQYHPGQREPEAHGNKLFSREHWVQDFNGDYILNSEFGQFRAQCAFGRGTTSAVYHAYLENAQGMQPITRRPVRAELAWGAAEGKLEKLRHAEAKRSDPVVSRQLISPKRLLYMQQRFPHLKRWTSMTEAKHQEIWDQVHAAGSISAWYKQYGPRRGA